MAADVASSEALVLRATPYGEADLVVHLLVRGRGRIPSFARGARRSARRFQGGIEPFTVVEVELSERRGSDLLDLRASTVLDAHLGLRTDLSRLAHAGYATELARELLREREPNDPLFELLRDTLSATARVGAASLVLRAFELGALHAVGLAPALDACVRCSADVERDLDSGFDARGGGVVCRTCRGPGAVALGPGPLALLRALQTHGPAGASGRDAAALPLEPVRRALHAFLELHVRRELRSVRFLRDVGAPP